MYGASNRVFVILGNGELQEGSNWEAAMAAAHHKSDNLIAIVDRHLYQTGQTEQMMALEPTANHHNRRNTVVGGCGESGCRKPSEVPRIGIGVLTTAFIGGAVAEVLADAWAGTPLKRLGLQDVFACMVGSHQDLKNRF